MPAVVVDFSAQESRTGAGGPSLTITHAAAAEDGDLLLLWAAARGLSTSGATTIDRPLGWTRLGTTQVHNFATSGRLGTALFYRFHDESEPTATVGLGGAWVDYVHLGVTVVRGQTPGIWTGSVAEDAPGGVTSSTVAPDPSPTVRALIISHYAKRTSIIFPAEPGWTNVGWDNSLGGAGGLASGASYITADPGTYTMPSNFNLRSSVAIVDTPAGGIYVGHPIGGAGIYAIG